MNALQKYKILRAEQRGAADHGWLRSKHTFSFADYDDPKWRGFRKLKVINEDAVTAGMGFGMHSHRDMEIFSYVIEGVLEHRDSLGNQRQLFPGEIQLMSAGQGVRHSEFNPSESFPTHFLQVWIEPSQRGGAPKYTEWKSDEKKLSQQLVISPNGEKGSAVIQQDVWVYLINLNSGSQVQHVNLEGRGVWVQVVKGAVRIGEETLVAGDGWMSEEAGVFDLQGSSEVAELILFDLN